MSSDSHKLSTSAHTRHLLRTVLLYKGSNNSVHFKYGGGTGQTTLHPGELFDRVIAEHNEPGLKTVIEAKIVGSMCQAPLLLAAADCLSRDAKGIVKFVTPKFLRMTSYTPPDVVFDYMCSNNTPQLTMLGGWRPVGVAEYRAYQFLSNPANWASHPAACVVDSLLPKPLQRRTKIVGDLPKALKSALAKLLCLIEDPRWFMTHDSLHEQHDGSLADICNHYGMDELCGYFGINCSVPVVTAALTNEHLFEPTTDAEERLLVLLQVCLGLETCPLQVRSFNLQEINSIFTTLIKGYFKTLPLAPSYTDLRKCLASPSGHAAVAFALKSVLLYLAKYWLHETAPVGWEFFVPQYFFEDIASPDRETKKPPPRVLPRADVSKLADSVIYARSAWPLKLGYKPLGVS